MTTGPTNWETSPTGNTATAWVGGYNDTAVFTAGSGAGPYTVNVPNDESINVGNITFAGPGYTLGTTSSDDDYHIQLVQTPVRCP